MKFTVSRRKYDTDIDTEVMSVQKSFGTYGENPDNDWVEKLYKKSNSEYYVYGKGGKNSPFSGANGDVRVWQKQNFNNAKSWIMDNCPEKMQDFTTMGEKAEVMTISVLPRTRQLLKQYSSEQGISVSELIRQFADSLYK